MNAISDDSIAHARRLAEADWAIIDYDDYRSLHYILDCNWSEFTQEYYIDHALLGCNVESTAKIPGLFSRMGDMRCTVCCDIVGYPYGKGSPKNDIALKDALEKRLALIA